MTPSIIRMTRSLLALAITGVTSTVSAQSPRSNVIAAGVFKANQVSKQAAPLPGNPEPKYPSVLKNAELEGEVAVEFVVDETGKADTSTFKVVRTTHPLFSMAVKNSLPWLRFSPAEREGKAVKQLVEMPFKFKRQ